MKFKHKLVLCMVVLLGLSFGLGGTMLIHRSFKTSLSSTIDSDLQNYESIQSTLLIAVDTNSVSSYIDMSNIINQLSAQGNSNRKKITLAVGKEIGAFFVDDIYYVEADLSKIRLVTKDGEFSLSISISKVQEVLEREWMVSNHMCTR